MNWTDKLLPCPFCGGRDFRISLSYHGKACKQAGDLCSIRCTKCDAEFRNVLMDPKHYNLIEGDLYRLIPTKYAEEVLLEKWNRRDG